MILTVSIGGTTPIIESASIRRSASDLVTTADISLPFNNLSAVTDNAEVAIELDGRVLFHGITADWSIDFAGGDCTMRVPCTDYSFRLARMVYAADDTVPPPEFAAGTDVGEIIYALLASTGINRTHINQATGVTIDETLTLAYGDYIQTIINNLCSQYGFLFYLSYGKSGTTYVTYAEFTTYTLFESSAEFTETHTITTSNLVTFSLGLKAVPEMTCTRVICTRNKETVDEFIELGVAMSGAAPYIDKVVVVDPSDNSDLDTLAASYLANYAKISSRMDIKFKDLSVGLFNLLDISGLSSLIGIALDQTQYRVTEITYDLTRVGVISTVQAVDIDTELWETTARAASGDAELDMLVGTQATGAVDSSKGQMGYIEVVGSDYVKVRYFDEKIEFISNLLVTDFEYLDTVLVVESQAKNKVPLLVSPPYRGDHIRVEYGTLSSGSALGIGYRHKSDYQNPDPYIVNIIHRFSWPENGGGYHDDIFDCQDTSGSWEPRSISLDAAAYDRTITLEIWVQGLPAGSVYRLDALSPNIGTIPDAGFESGAFGDGTTAWQLFEARNTLPRCDAAINSDDAYAGTYSCVFTGVS